MARCPSASQASGEGQRCAGHLTPSSSAGSRSMVAGLTPGAADRSKSSNRLRRGKRASMRRRDQRRPSRSSDSSMAAGALMSGCRRPTACHGCPCGGWRDVAGAGADRHDRGRRASVGDAANLDGHDVGVDTSDRQGRLHRLDDHRSSETPVQQEHRDQRPVPPRSAGRGPEQLLDGITDVVDSPPLGTASSR
jgi:hypothetical protein